MAESEIDTTLLQYLIRVGGPRLKLLQYALKLRDGEVFTVSDVGKRLELSLANVFNIIYSSGNYRNGIRTPLTSPPLKLLSRRMIGRNSFFAVEPGARPLIEEHIRRYEQRLAEAEELFSV